MDTSYIDSLKNEGNYRQAIKLYKEAFNTSISLSEKVDIQHKIRISENYYKRVIDYRSGEAYFPVINGNNGRGIVLTGRVSQGEPNKLPKGIKQSWEKTKRIMSDFLDDYLHKNKNTIKVLDWGMEKYIFTIRPIPNSKINLYNHIEGSSIELAMFVSLLSFILGEKISDDYAFSGEVNEGFRIDFVTGIKEKTDAIILERPKVKKFFIPSGSNSGGKIQKNVDTLEQIVNQIFPRFNKLLSQLQDILGIRRLILKMSKAKLGSVLIDYAEFNLGNRENIKDDEGEKVYNFLFDNLDKCKNLKKGLIISGLTINYSAPMFVLPLFNHTPSFIALKYTGAKSKPGESIAYIILSKLDKYKIGSAIKFLEPK